MGVWFSFYKGKTERTYLLPAGQGLGNIHFILIGKKIGVEMSVNGKYIKGRDGSFGEQKCIEGAAKKQLSHKAFHIENLKCLHRTSFFVDFL